MGPVLAIAGGEILSPNDICKTPFGPSVVPIPYPNIGVLAIAQPTSVKMLIQGAPVLTVRAKGAISCGDEAGEGGGVISGSVSGEFKPSGSNKAITIEGDAVTDCTTMFTTNAGNAIAAVLEPNQQMVILMR
jgi:hypothetical protein